MIIRGYILILLLIRTTTTYDIATEGQRIILQTDIETVLVHTKLGNLGQLLDKLLIEADGIRTSAIKDHVSNKVGNEGSRVNKLVSASIIATVKQIDIVRNDFIDFFAENAEPTNNKRALEILGSFLSTMTGVPSARDHRKVLEQIKLLKLDSSELTNLKKKRNGLNKAILENIPYQENLIFNTTNKVEELSRKSEENADSLERIIAVMSVTNKVNSALEHARISIGHLKAIMAVDKMNLLSSVLTFAGGGPSSSSESREELNVRSLFFSKSRKIRKKGTYVRRTQLAREVA